MNNDHPIHLQPFALKNVRLGGSRQCGRRRRGLSFETLESRQVLSAAAHDLVGLTALRNDPAFAGIDGSGVSVAVIDTGLDHTHPLLAGNYVAGADIVFGGNIPHPVGDHGTHVAGTVGATDPDIGVAPAVGLIGLQVFTPQPGGAPGAYNVHTEEALQWVLEHRAEYNIVAVNMSLGGGHHTSPDLAASDILADDIRRLEAAGVTVVSAAGNAYGLTPSGVPLNNSGSPGIISTLNVGAVWETNEGQRGVWGDGTFNVSTDADRVVGFSQRPPLDVGNVIFAPGAQILSTVPGGGLADMSGTSMASPLVAGVVALLQDAALTFGGRLLSSAEVRDAILTTADAIFDGDDEDDLLFLGDFNSNGVADDEEFNNLRYTNQRYPRVNAHAAVRHVRDLFEDTGGQTGDANGTLAGAILGPQLAGGPVAPLVEAIGQDGSTNAVGPTDVDIVRFQVSVPGAVTIEVATNEADPADFDSLLRLFNAQGAEIGFDDDGGEEGFSKLTATLTAGSYFVGVSGAGNRSYNPRQAGSGTPGATGNYALHFSLGSSDPNGVIAGAVAFDISSNFEPEIFPGFIGADLGQAVGPLDVDLFEVHVPDNGMLSVDVDTPFDADFADSFVRVFNLFGSQVAASDDQLAPWESIDPFTGLVYDQLAGALQGHGVDAFAAVPVRRGDVVYIGVSDYCQQNYNPASLGGRQAVCGATGGLYNLTVTFANNDQNGSIEQAVGADVVPLPASRAAGMIGADFGIAVGDRDVDFLKVNSPTAGILEIEIDSFSLANNSDPVDTVVTIFDAQGNPLGQNDDSDGLDPRLQVEIAAHTDYYVAVSGYGNTSYDPFLLGSGTSGDVGLFEFNSRVLPLSSASLLSDQAAGFAGVRTVESGSSTSAFVGRDGSFVRGAADVDVYRFTPRVSGPVQIRAEAVGEFGADTFLRVFTAQGAEITRNDDASPRTTDSQLTLQAAAGQTYLIGVNGYSTRAGDYNPLTGAGAAAGSQGAYLLTIGEPSPRAAGLAGDYNGSGRVEQGDLDLVLLNWGRRANAAPQIWVNDLPSGNIDQDELDAVLLGWGNVATSGTAGAAAHPRALPLIGFEHITTALAAAMAADEQTSRSADAGLQAAVRPQDPVAAKLPRDQVFERDGQADRGVRTPHGCNSVAYDWADLRAQSTDSRLLSLDMVFATLDASQDTSSVFAA